MTTTVSQIASALGGAKALRTRVDTLDELVETILRGLTYATFEALTTNYGLLRELAGQAISVPERTLARRKRARFATDESDRLARLGRIAALAEEVLGSREKAGRWLQKSNRALGGVMPIERLRTEPGARQVEEILLRIEHGVIS